MSNVKTHSIICLGLCPDWQDWNPNDSLENASEAMGLADDWLNVRQVRISDQIIANYCIISSHICLKISYPIKKKVSQTE